VEDAVGISPSFAGGKGFPLSRVFVRVDILRVGSMNVEKGVGDKVKVASYDYDTAVPPFGSELVPGETNGIQPML
jgi:hypothetical protein